MEDRINKIYKSKEFQYSMDRIAKLEDHRQFCRHGLEHSMDVARIAYIMCLEKGLNIKKDVIYAAALLHDIGRWMQYDKGIQHEAASSGLAHDILMEADFCSDEIELIQKAILNHRNSNAAEDLCGIIYKSDKISRNCFNCSAEKQCNWDSEKKNKAITY